MANDTSFAGTSIVASILDLVDLCQSFHSKPRKIASQRKGFDPLTRRRILRPMNKPRRRIDACQELDSDIRPSLAPLDPSLAINTTSNVKTARTRISGEAKS